MVTVDRLLGYRVSFGSNKGGSMVETLIYDSVISEEEPSAALPNWKTNKNQRNLRTLVAANESTPEENVALIRYLHSIPILILILILD